MTRPFETTPQSYQGDIGSLESREAQAVHDPTTDGVGVKLVARITYDFAVDGGAVGTITPSKSPALPIKACVTGGWVEIITPFTSGADATIAMRVESANDISIDGSFGSASALSAGLYGTPGVFVLDSTRSLTSVAGRQFKLTIGVAALTAGKAVFVLEYFVGS
jgi:hypothetical protein